MKLFISLLVCCLLSFSYAALPPTTGPWTTSMSVTDVSCTTCQMYLYPTTATLIQSSHTWFTVAPVAGSSPVIYTIRHSTGYYLSGDYDNGMFSLDSTSNKNWFNITYLYAWNAISYYAPPNIGIYKIQNIYRAYSGVCSSASYLAVKQLGMFQNIDLRYSTSPEPNGWYIPDPLPAALYYSVPIGAYSLPSNVDGFTVTAVVKPNAGAIGRIWDRIVVGTSNGWLFDLYPALTPRALAGGGTFYASPIPANCKTHLAFVYSSINGKIYMYANGTQTFVSPYEVYLQQNTNLNLRCGYDSNGGTTFQGTIQRGCVYTQTLTPLQIDQDFAQSRFELSY